MPHLRMCRANVQSYQLDTFPAAFLSVMLTLTLFACQGRAIPDFLNTTSFVLANLMYGWKWSIFILTGEHNLKLPVGRSVTHTFQIFRQHSY